MKIKKKSKLTGIVREMDIDVTQEQLDAYERREGLIQDIFPHITPDEREFLMTGITPSEWEEYMAPEDPENS